MKIKKGEFICIVCPKGCHLKTDSEMNVTGNACKRGAIYAINEMTNPTRMITSTVIINSKYLSRLPVITNKPIPKDKIFAVMKEINKISINAPVKVKDIIIKDVLGLSVDIVATREVLE